MSIVIPQTDPDTPVLFLLHGLSDDHSTWMRRTSIERYADAYRIAVVMPEVHRSFYTNTESGYRYFDYISEEVPELIEHYFGFLSTRRENRFVAGLSMGGYGAFKMALSNPERYAYAASFSGALEVRNLANDDAEWTREYTSIFGTKDTFRPENDLYTLIRRVKGKKMTVPFLYQTCGTEDFLIDVNRRFRKEIEADPEITSFYEEEPGDHTWEYWDKKIKDFLAFIPLSPQ
jgi:S-formylglutathione hydrolase FrmB